MKKIYLYCVLIFSTIVCYPQSNVDSIRMDYIAEDSVRFIVYVTLPYCQQVDSTCYLERLDTINVTFYYSEEIPQCDCEFCQRSDTFYIERDKYTFVEYKAMVRIMTNSGYTEYFNSAEGYYLMENGNNWNKENEVSFSIFPNPVYDKLFIENPSNDFIGIKIYDIYGKCIMEEKGNLYCIDIDFLHCGLYLIQLNDESFYKIIKE